MPNPSARRAVVLFSVYPARERTIGGGIKLTANSELRFPDAVSVQSFSFHFNEGRAWRAELTLFDPTFDAVETAFDVFGIGGAVVIKYGWMHDLADVNSLKEIRGVLLSATPEYSAEGTTIKCDIQAVPPPGLLKPTNAVSTKDGRRVIVVVEDPKTVTKFSDLANIIAKDYGYKTVRDGASTIEETRNGPDFTVEQHLALLYQFEDETYVDYLRRVISVGGPQPAGADGHYVVYEIDNFLYFHSDTYIGDKTQRQKFKVKEYTLHRGFDGELIDFQLQDDSVMAAFQGAQGVLFRSTDPDTGRPITKEIRPDQLRNRKIMGGYQQPIFKDALAHISREVPPGAIEALAKAQVARFQATVRATARIIGDPHIVPLDTVIIRILKPNGSPQWQSGYYRIYGFTQSVSEDGSYETSLDLMRAGHQEGAEKVPGITQLWSAKGLGDAIAAIPNVINNAVNALPREALIVKVIEIEDSVNSPKPFRIEGARAFSAVTGSPEAAAAKAPARPGELPRRPDETNVNRLVEEEK